MGKRVIYLLNNAGKYFPNWLKPIGGPILNAYNSALYSVLDIFPGRPVQTPHGVTIYTNKAPPAERRMITGEFESEAINYILEETSQINRCADVGAHVGYFSILMAVHNGTHVDAFEPNPANRKKLHKNIQLNNCQSVNIIDQSVGAECGVAELDVSSVGGHSAIMKDTSPNTVSVEMTTLDSYYGTQESPEMIKIDVEGFEPEVLSGGRDLLSEHTPPLLMELHPEFVDDTETYLQRIVSGIPETGYSTARVLETGETGAPKKVVPGIRTNNHHVVVK